MPDRKLSSIAPGIVVRLRIVFAAVSMALVCVMLVTFEQMRYLNTSVEELTEKSISRFVITEESERSIKRLLLLLQRVDGARDLAEIFRLGDLVQDELSTLQTKTAEMATPRSPESVTIDMQSWLTEIDFGSRKILGLQSAILERETRVSTLRKLLGESGDQARSYLEEMSYAAALTAQNKTKTTFTGTPIQMEAFIQDYHESLALANTVTTISLELEAVIDVILRIESSSELGDSSITYKNLRQKMRNIAVLTGQLVDNKTRADLSRLILKMREVLFGTDGIVSEVKQLQKLREELLWTKQAQYTPIEQISALSAEMLKTARSEIEFSRQKLGNATQKVITILAVVMLLTLAAIAATLICVVERQINKRMARLTKAVLAIADGETSYKVDVSGPDELGKMAKSLQVFKSTAEELHRSNAELEKFAYVAAHDLRSPLRAIQDLSGWLVEDTENVFSGEGQQYMALMTGRIERLNQLLTDLLEYSRAGSIGIEFSHVSIREIVKETGQMLDPLGNFDIRFVGACDSVITYETPLRQILLNLINNAMKHHDRMSGKVTVFARISGDRLICKVQDDGCGIDPKYHEKIFGLFQTLRPRDEVEASGLGLAIICKLLERLGGKIAVESDPSLTRGATFTFDLPISVASVQHINKAA